MPLFSVAPRPAAPTAAPTAPVGPTEAATHTASDAVPDEVALAVVRAVTALPARSASGGGVSVAADALPMVLDPFAVASRAVLVLIGSTEPAKHIARTAIEMSMEHDSTAAIDVVIPRAIDLVLRRAAHLVSIGAGPQVVDHYTQRLELWRRLARRRGLEPAAVVLSLAPFPAPVVAAMLRVPVAEVELCLDDWYAGIDPPDDSPASLPSSDDVIDLREPQPAPTGAAAENAAAAGPNAAAAGADSGSDEPGAARREGRRPAWGRLRLRSA